MQTAEILRREMAAQAALVPKPEDAAPWLTRFLFVPFRDRKLSPYYQNLYGMPTGKLRKGVISRISRFVCQEIDHDAVNRVPTDRYGNFVGASLGTQEMKGDQRKPADVIAGILRSHNPNGVSGGAEDNGIIEVVALRGVDDLIFWGNLQLHFLPNLYNTAREQLAQLEKAATSVRSNPNLFYADSFQKAEAVGEALLHSTNLAVAWGAMKYGRMQAAVEEYGRTGKSGKRELSPFDKDLCRWLEVPEPKLTSMLQGLQQSVRQAEETSIPYTLCEDCGNVINLVNGNLPRRGCLACGWNPNEPVKVSDEQPATSPSKQDSKKNQR